MREAEGIDDAIRSVVAAAGIPADEVRVGAELHHRIGACRPREGVPVFARSDKRIDEAQEIFVRSYARRLRRAGGEDACPHKEGC